jgi:RNA polymerase sigma factor (sigma-70 family)
MTRTRADRVLGEVGNLLAEHALGEWPDSRHLERFVSCRDEAAFAALLDRHGPAVLRVCRSVLGDCHDAEDAFQATFLVLACNAPKVRNGASVGSFLHGTAYRVALRARQRALRQRAAERGAAQMRAQAVDRAVGQPDAEAALNEELGRLPDRLRSVLVLCHLEGKTHAQAAAALGCPVGSVSRHLRRARARLRERLAARGVAAPAALLGAALTAVPAALARETLRAVRQYVAGSALVGGSSVPAVTLAKEVLQNMAAFKLKALVVLLLLVGLAAGGTAVFATSRPAPQKREPAPLLVAAPLPAKNDTPAERVDGLGDPLPDGAAARLGAARLRQGTQVCALAFSSNGHVLATIGNDANLCLWEVPSGRELGRLAKLQHTHNAVAFADSVKTMAAVSDGGFVSLYDFTPARPGDRKPAALGKERLRIKPEEGYPRLLAFLPDGNLLGATHDGRVYLWDLDGKEVRRFGKPDATADLAFAVSADGKKIAIGGNAGDVVIWDVNKGVGLVTLAGRTKVSSLAFSPDGKTLAAGDETNTVRLWDVAAGKVTASLVGEKARGQTRGVGDAIHALAFTPDGKTLVSTGDYGDGTIRVWDVAAAKERRRINSQFGDTRLLALSPDGKTLAVTGMSCVVRLWDLTTGKELDGDLGSQGAVYKVAVSPDSKQVAAAGCDGVIRFWDRASGKELRSFRAHERQIFGLAFSPDGKRLASSGSYEAARLWDLAEGKEICSYPGSTRTVLGVNNVCYAPDGKKLSLSTNRGVIELADAEGGKVERTFGEGAIDRMALAPDGTSLAGAGSDKLLHLWDRATGKEKWSAVHDGVWALAFAPDGRYLAAGDNDNAITLRDAATGKVVRKLAARCGAVRSVAISPDGRLLAASGDTNRVGLFEVESGQLILEFDGHCGPVWSVAFAPDGRSLVSGSFDATALVWDLTGRELAKKRRGPLTDAELDAAWSALSAAPAEGAYKAVLALAAAPKQSVPLLRATLTDGAPPAAKEVAKLLADLDDDSFEVREKASRALAGLGKGVAAELRREREATRSVEVRRRLDDLLEKLTGGAGTGKADELVRSQRIIAVLELAATAEAKELLEHLSKKASSGDLRRQAEGALDRQAKRL